MSNFIEQLYGPILRGPLVAKTNSSTSMFAGVFAVNSGSSTATVSTTLVNSDTLIFLTSYTAQSSHYSIRPNVTSRGPGGSFTVTLDKTTVTSDYQLAWWMALTS